MVPEGWTYEVENQDEESAETDDYQVKQTNVMTNKPPTYMQQFEAELKDKLAELIHPNKLGETMNTEKLLAFVKWSKNKHLESYRNGVKVGSKDNPDWKKEKRSSNEFKK